MTFIKWWWKNKFLDQVRSEGFQFGVFLYSSLCLVLIIMSGLDHIGFPIWEIIITLVLTIVFCALSFAIHGSVKDVINDYKKYKENK